MNGIRTPGVERVQTPVALGAEEELDRSLRPRRLEDFVGQERVKDQLAVFIEAAKARGEPLDHVLLAGPPGLGKTSLAQIVASELGAEFVATAGPALERKGDVASYLTALEPHSVFFVDEIHRLPRALEETFYPAMEDRRLPITVGQGAGARVVTLDLPAFTMIGATTRTGLLTTPLRDRFGVSHRLELYEPRDLARIVMRSAGILEVEIDDAGAEAIAERSRGTPRVANRLLKRARDFAEVRGAGHIDAQVAREALDLLEVDAAGLDRLDRAILSLICEKFGGGPVGLSTLAVAVGEEPDTIEDVYEPYLLQQGFLMRTPRGRVATDAAFAHLGLERPAAARASASSRPQDPWLTSALGERLPYERHAQIHLPELRGSQPLHGTDGRLSEPRPCLQEVRLRLSLRAARRLLPGAQRRLLHPRSTGQADRHGAGRARAHGPRRPGCDRPSGDGRSRPRVRRR